MKTHKSYVLVPLTIEALMTAVCAAFASGDTVTLKYTDGSSESAICPKEAQQIRDYATYNSVKRPRVVRGVVAPEAPSFFAIVSAVQETARKPVNA